MFYYLFFVWFCICSDVFYIQCLYQYGSTEKNKVMMMMMMYRTCTYMENSGLATNILTNTHHYGKTVVIRNIIYHVRKDWVINADTFYMYLYKRDTAY
jgi:hypothetical protein